MRYWLATATIAALACGSPVSAPAAGEGRAAAVAAEVEGYEVVRSFPHDPSAFTQGLVYHDGYLLEGTGRRGQSSLRRVEIESGRVLQAAELSPALFGEGIALHDGRIYQLTWTSGTGFVYDAQSFKLIDRFRQVAPGWGLTSDGEALIQSDGTRTLYFLDPASMQVERTVDVRDADGFIDQINELEYIDGEIFANVWHSWEILRISPRDGRVLGRIDMHGLLDTDRLPDPESVLNGIAYDPERGRIFVTGKLWPRIFEIRFVRR